LYSGLPSGTPVSGSPGGGATRGVRGCRQGFLDCWCSCTRFLLVLFHLTTSHCKRLLPWWARMDCGGFLGVVAWAVASFSVGCWKKTVCSWWGRAAGSALRRIGELGWFPVEAKVKIQNSLHGRGAQACRCGCSGTFFASTWVPFWPGFEAMCTLLPSAHQQRLHRGRALLSLRAISCASVLAALDGRRSVLGGGLRRNKLLAREAGSAWLLAGVHGV